MSMLSVILVGLGVGILARTLVPKDDPTGLILTWLLGIGGAVGANYFGHAVGWYSAGETAGPAMACMGGMALILSYWFFRRLAPLGATAGKRF